MNDPERYLTVDDVAQRLQVHPETVRRWLRAGRLPGIRLDADKSGWRIPESTLRSFLDARRTGDHDAR